MTDGIADACGMALPLGALQDHASLWIVLELVAVLVCGIGAMRWRSALATGQGARVSRSQRQTIGGAILVAVIAIRLITHTW